MTLLQTACQRAFQDCVLTQVLKQTGTFPAKALTSEERLTWNDHEGPAADN